MTRFSPALLLCAPMLLLGACSKDAPTIPCPLCYEDAWSREPFTGEAKQHIKPLTPEELEANGLSATQAAAQAIGVSAQSSETTPQ